MKVTISDDAKEDLRSIATYVARDNPQRAGSLVRELRARCRSIASFPHKHQLVPRFESRGVRRLALGNYLIFFYVDQHEAVVIRILHAARDIERLLDLGPQADNDE